MQDRRRTTLIALNVTLLTLVAIVTFAPMTSASSAQVSNTRPRGEYSMVGGQITGGTPSVVYIVDSNNDEMVALRWNNGRSLLEPIGFRDLAADAKVQNQGGPR